MPKCSTCGNEVTWAVETNSLAYGTSKVPVNAGQICTNLSAVVRDLRSSWPPLTSSKPLDSIIRSLCAKCWESEATSIARAEGKPDPTYHGSAAKTTAPSACGSAYPSGIFINVDKADYRYFPSERENIEFCLSTTVHELMHFLSAGSCGLQVEGDAVNFDECMTDYFAMKTYFRTFPDRTYVTNYGAKATFLKATKKTVYGKIFGSHMSDDYARIKKEWPHGMAEYVTAYVGENPGANDPARKDAFNNLKQHMARAFVYYLFRLLPMWYFGGPTQSSPEADEWFGPGATFATCKNIVTPFVPKNNLGNELKTYASGDAPGGYTELFNLNPQMG